jgi:hypothetical protein
MAGILSTSQGVADARFFARKDFPTGSIIVDKCPICGFEDRDEDVLGGNTNWAICHFCFSGYNMTIPTNKEIADFYVHDYRASAEPKPYPNRTTFKTHVYRTPRQLKYVHEDVKEMRAGLDIGCALGWTVKTMDFLGMEAYGVEYHNVDREWATKNLGVNICARLKDLPRRDFDLVNMSHVLEHIADPIGYLKMLQEENYLARGGKLIIEVPGMSNFSSWTAYHLVVFNPESLVFTLLEAGLEVVESETYIPEGTKHSSLMWAVGRREE